jgi:hypothetical protein
LNKGLTSISSFGRTQSSSCDVNKKMMVKHQKLHENLMISPNMGKKTWGIFQWGGVPLKQCRTSQSIGVRLPPLKDGWKIPMEMDVFLTS